MKNTKLWIAAASVIFASAVIWCIFIMNKPQSDIVTITQDGQMLYMLDLSKEKDRCITVQYDGRENVIEIKDGRIRILEAGCPDHTCINTGWLEDVPIVCLPNKLVIEFADKDTDAAAR